MRYTCIASKQTTGIKEEEYNIFVAGDSHSTAGNSAILIYKNDDYFSLAEDAKKKGADLMIVGEYTNLKHWTTTLPSIHCYKSIIGDLAEYISQNESAFITIERIRETDVTQDM